MPLETVFTILAYSSRAFEHAARASGVTCERKAAGLTLFFNQPAYDTNGDRVGIEVAKLKFRLYDRKQLGIIKGVPVEVDPYLVIPDQGQLTLNHPKPTAAYYPTDEEAWWWRIEKSLKQMQDKIPGAFFEVATRTWWIGDYGYNLDTKEEIL